VARAECGGLEGCIDRHHHPLCCARVLDEQLTDGLRGLCAAGVAVFQFDPSAGEFDRVNLWTNQRGNYAIKL